MSFLALVLYGLVCFLYAISPPFPPPLPAQSQLLTLPNISLFFYFLAGAETRPTTTQHGRPGEIINCTNTFNMTGRLHCACLSMCSVH